MISKIGANLTFRGQMIVPSVSQVNIVDGRDYDSVPYTITTNEISSIGRSPYKGYTQIGKANGEKIYVPNNRATNQDILLAYLATYNPNKNISVECGRY